MEKEKIIKKKSLGQNFLKDERVLEKICASGEIEPGEKILEIGPGDGALTEKLLKSGGMVTAIEKDHRLIEILNEKFKSAVEKKSFSLIEKDVLDFNPRENGFEAGKYKIIANIPYYITGQILRQALSKWPQPKKIVLLIQKEVAERIVTRNGKESLLSISVKIFGTPRIAGVVKAGAFAPSPKVDSAILVIENISKERFTKKTDEELFFEILRAGFAHKRKILSSNLKGVLSKPEELLRKCGLPEKIRAEKLTLENWLCLARKKL